MRLVAWLNECHNAIEMKRQICMVNVDLTYCYTQHVQLGQSQILLMLLGYKACIKCNPKPIEIKIY